jgi:hypothetical protein
MSDQDISNMECGFEETVWRPSYGPPDHGGTKTFRCLRVKGHSGEHCIGMELVARDDKRLEIGG